MCEKCRKNSIQKYERARRRDHRGITSTLLQVTTRTSHSPIFRLMAMLDTLAILMMICPSQEGFFYYTNLSYLDSWTKL